MKVSMLTTIDNPYSPFDDFDKWYDWDCRHGYNSCSLLDRLSYTSEALSDFLNAEEIERAIDEIVEVNVSGMHIKITKEINN